MKKSETLEIRIPYPTKQAFMARCQAEGRSASETLRDLIEQRLSPRPPAREPRRLHQIVAAALIAATVGAAAAPALARATLASRFEALDANHDGLLTPAEFGR
jgi:hypothetical protein